MSDEGYKFGQVQTVCLIGGGVLMYRTAKIYKAAGYQVGAVIAPRHKDEVLTDSDKSLETSLIDEGVSLQLTEEINSLSSWDQKKAAGENALCLCFGPAWVFSDEVIKVFDHGMYNINPIPIPHYLGGAHYTWQLLNDNLEGGCFFQKITSQLDRGPLLSMHRFAIPQEAATPQEYYDANEHEGEIFIRELCDRMKQDDVFSAILYEDVNEQRLYFPRLRTDKQGYIDWSWSQKEIAQFCCGFDDPYAGARTFIDGRMVCLKKVEPVDQSGEYHPFCSGLIVRKTKEQFLVATKDGLLSIGEICDENGNDLKPGFREGMRLFTSRQTLDEALSYYPKLSSKGFED